MHHGTCVMHVPWCMSGSLTCGGGENVPGIPGACALAILLSGKRPMIPKRYLTHYLITSATDHSRHWRTCTSLSPTFFHFFCKRSDSFTQFDTGLWIQPLHPWPRIMAIMARDTLNDDVWIGQWHPTYPNTGLTFNISLFNEKRFLYIFYAIQPNGIVISNNPLLTGELQWSYKHK